MIDEAGDAALFSGVNDYIVIDAKKVRGADSAALVGAFALLGNLLADNLANVLDDHVIGVNVLLDSKVRMIDADGVTTSDRRIYSRTVLWAAGVAASPAAKWLNAEADKAGRVKVQRDLSVPHLPDVYVIGDTALANGWKGEPVPGLAPAAKQGGAFVAKVIRAKLHGEPVPHAFSYRHMGSLATIGRKSAVADFGFVRLRGAIAWWLWASPTCRSLSDHATALAVVLNWIWSYVTYRASTRLITGEIK